MSEDVVVKCESMQMGATDPMAASRSTKVIGEKVRIEVERFKVKYEWIESNIWV